MTTFSDHGFPDWRRLEAQADVTFINDSRGIAAGFTYPAFFAGAYAYLGFTFISNTGPMKVQFEWFADAALSFLIESDEFVVTNGLFVGDSIPSRGPWCQVVVNVGSGASWNYSLLVTGQLSPVPPAMFGTPDTIIDASPTVGAGANFSAFSLITYSRACVFSWRHNATVFTMSINGLDEFGNRNLIFEADQNIGTSGVATVALMRRPTRIDLNNGDTGSRIMRIHLTALRPSPV